MNCLLLHCLNLQSIQLLVKHLQQYKMCMLFFIYLTILSVISKFFSVKE